jgi:outer membrane protein TolC
MPVADFLTQTLPPPPDKQIPAYVQSALSRAVAAEKIKGAQTAALLPKVALFGQGSLENGNRATGTSYTAGAYLQWDLLDVPNWDRGAQADSDALAAQAGAESARQQSESEQIDAGETQKALQVNLELMDQSSRLLDEQTETARNLFKDGSINALQLVEVLSRRADLITARAQAERGLVQAHVSLAVNSGFQEPISER